MLKISKQVDYGILLLAHCSGGTSDAVYSTRDLAAASGLPVPMVSKILKGLAREGILESFRGTKGGYSLARSAGEITVAAIVRALEGPVRLVDCASEPLGPCRFRGQCRVVHPMKALADSVRELLERTTLENLITVPAPEEESQAAGDSTGGARPDPAPLTIPLRKHAQ
ncbi:MAG: Rrf2 family transcriptional regulator [Planctomycetota bacterium]